MSGLPFTIIKLHFKEDDKDFIGVNGTEKLCTSIKVDPSDVHMLAFAWRLGATKMCHFTRQQWAELKNYNVKSVDDIKRTLPLIMRDAISNFESYYKFAFSFGLDLEKGERTLPVDIAVALWKLVFCNPEKQSIHLENWLNFLSEHKIKGISKDTWDLYLVFTQTIDSECNNYDPMEAWPSLLDEFVEDLRGKQNQ